MAKRVVDDASLTAVADAIRAKTGKTDGLTFPTDFETSVEDVFAAGEKSEYDRFWDAYQQNGNRTNYSYAFRDIGWTDDTFKPKYPIVLTGNVYNILDNSAVSYIDGSIVDCSGVTLLQYFLSNNQSGKPITAIMDISSCNSMTNTFVYSDNLETVDLKNIKEDCTFSNTFLNCTGLVNFRCTGTIGTAFNLSSCIKLSKTSLESVINALSTTTTGLSVSLRLMAVNAAFETSEGAADGSTSAEWTELANTKSNWTINLS